jgi:hypothetical protein
VTLSGNLSQFLPEIVMIQWRARGWPERETSDTPSGAEGNVGVRKKRAMQGAAWRARRQRQKETSDVASGAVGKISRSERNIRCGERRGGEDLNE